MTPSVAAALAGLAEQPHLDALLAELQSQTHLQVVLPVEQLAGDLLPPRQREVAA